MQNAASMTTRIGVPINVMTEHIMITGAQSLQLAVKQPVLQSDIASNKRVIEWYSQKERTYQLSGYN